MKFFALRLLQAGTDVVVLVLALVLAFALRFEGEIPELMLKRMAFLAPYVVATQFGLLRAFGTHRFSWRFVGLREVIQIFRVLAGTAVLLVAVRLFAALVAPRFGYAVYFAMPMGVTLIDFVLAFLGIVGVRILRRLTAERAERDARRLVSGQAVRTMLIGAGQAGLLVAKELDTRPDLGILPLGFVDDSVGKRGTVIHGVPVLGGTEDLVALCEAHDAEQILITIASAKGIDIRRIHGLCAETGLPIKIVPGLYELMDGSVNLSRIREVTIEDLLGRPPVDLGDEAIRAAVSGARVLVTGAGGSIGSEICRQLLALEPTQLVLLEQAENSLFHIHRELVALPAAARVEVVPCIADITDEARIAALFDSYQPQLVFHAAAHKHVPMMEWNVGEAIKNNVFGTQNVARAARAANVAKFVMISTDKAVNPTSVMGCTKRVAELVVQSMNSPGSTQFITVRFGNVLGSAGSVIPLFKEQIARGGPVTVTHPEMTRFFMTIPEACQLVLHASVLGAGGEVFILDMGEPVRIVDLAQDLIRLSGMDPNVDIAIEFTGVRPGEKLFEELSSDHEAAEKTKHPKIFIGTSGPSSTFGAKLGPDANDLVELLRLADSASDEILRQKLHEIVPEYRTTSVPALPI